jgi:hypothetical protein
MGRPIGTAGEGPAPTPHARRASGGEAAGHGLAGGDFYQSRIATRSRERDLIRQLERLTGKSVTPQPNA